MMFWVFWHGRARRLSLNWRFPGFRYLFGFVFVFGSDFAAISSYTDWYVVACVMVWFPCALDFVVGII